jgi:hypothetical protein
MPAMRRLANRSNTSIEWIVENGHAFDAEGIKHGGGETGDSEEEYEEEEED